MIRHNFLFPRKLCSPTDVVTQSAGGTAPVVRENGLLVPAAFRRVGGGLAFRAAQLVVMSHGPSGALGHWDLLRSRRTAHCERPRVPTGHPARLCTRSLNDYKKKKKGKSRGVVAAGVAGDLQWGCEFQRQEKERARRNLRQRAPRPKSMDP
ncbi:unnamed protein product [Trypanosoma congolense IL3000]|uniref:WGS project CAEQ00000000 data, annotated contig 994 n=1 Tax=Trypanosoma congolense (strain IL3000) TaxID=1068625 RepID=F9WK72_TRYCI|nr:unnamed protein product [Trypanosoma congolense IL3000]